MYAGERGASPGRGREHAGAPRARDAPGDAGAARANGGGAATAFRVGAAGRDGVTATAAKVRD
eukprot:455673-Prymnesium_polylepis.1